MSIEYALSALVLGFIVAIPPGSVTVVASQRALQYGFRNSLWFTFGSCVSDSFYLLLVFFGVANVVAQNGYLKIALWFVSAAVLIFLAVSSITTAVQTNGDTTLFRLQSGRLATFISGVLVTLANPLTIVGWIAVAGNFYLVWSRRLPNIHNYSIISIAVIMAGVLPWSVPLVFIISRVGRLLNSRLTKILVVASNVLLFGFGLLALYYACAAVVRLWTVVGRQ